MAFTTPRNWVAYETVSDTIMNTHLRDQLRYLKGLDSPVAISAALSAPSLSLATPLPAASGGTGVTALPAFFVTKNNVDQNIQPYSASGYQLVTWPSISFDTNGNFNSSASKFQPTVAGVYLFTFALYFAGATDTAAFYGSVYKNGGQFTEGQIHASGTAGFSLSGLALVQMNGSTDYVQLYATHSDSVARTMGGTPVGTFFAGARVG